MTGAAERNCGVCGRSLAGRRRSAEVCSDACRQRKARSRLWPGVPAGLSDTTPSEEGVDGPVERKVRGDVGALTTTHPMGEALAEMSFLLARVIDEGAGFAAPAVHRELRANLAELTSLAGSDDDE